MFLVNVPGSTSFQQSKIVNGVTHATFRNACQALDLLKNDDTGMYVLMTHAAHHLQIKEIYNEALIMIEDLCLQIGNKVLIQLRMPSLNGFTSDSFDVELRSERSYNTVDLLSYVQSNIPKLTLSKKAFTTK
ncbi:unnamed protein product [Onchocerca ochengi]|uniref:TP_methylase domain-containing protein n=1 Tax=Onchocerca ochengi TaxID=42157 RepID=A0A182E689_ONCOC|nr:unnamed protein product [Onchocerca ochengi]